MTSTEAILLAVVTVGMIDIVVCLLFHDDNGRV